MYKCTQDSNNNIIIIYHSGRNKSCSNKPRCCGFAVFGSRNGRRMQICFLVPRTTYGTMQGTFCLLYNSTPVMHYIFVLDELPASSHKSQEQDDPYVFLNYF